METMPGIRSAAEECLGGVPRRARSCTDVWALRSQVRAPGSSPVLPCHPQPAEDRRGFMARHKSKLIPVRSAARQNTKVDT